jgi:hypothetical protein
MGSSRGDFFRQFQMGTGTTPFDVEGLPRRLGAVVVAAAGLILAVIPSREDRLKGKGYDPAAAVGVGGGVALAILPVVLGFGFRRGPWRLTPKGQDDGVGKLLGQVLGGTALLAYAGYIYIELESQLGIEGRY